MAIGSSILDFSTSCSALRSCAIGGLNAQPASTRRSELAFLFLGLNRPVGGDSRHVGCSELKSERQLDQTRAADLAEQFAAATSAAGA